MLRDLLTGWPLYRSKNHYFSTVEIGVKYHRKLDY